MPLRVVTVVVLSVSAVLCELGGIAILYQLFTEGGKDWAIPGVTYLTSVLRAAQETSEFGVLLIPVGLLIASSVLNFLSVFQVVRLATSYSKIALQDLYSAIDNASYWPQGEATREFGDNKALNRIQRNVIMVTSRVLRVFHTLWVPLMMFFGGLFVLSSINIELAIIIGVVMAVIVLAVGAVGVQASRNNAKWESVSGTVFRQLNLQMDRVVCSGKGGATDFNSWQPLDNLIGLLKGRILTVAYSRLVVSMGMIGTLLILFGYLSRDGENIAGLVMVMVLVVRVFVSLKGIATTLTVINRFYPQLRRYYRLMEILSGKDGNREEQSPDRSVRVIVTDLANNKLNRLRWRWLLYAGDEVEFCEGGNCDGISLRPPSDGLQDVQGYVWLDLKAMGNTMPLKVPRVELKDWVSRFCKGAGPATQSGPMEDDDFED